MHRTSTSTEALPDTAVAVTQKPATWRNMPNKWQLIVIAAARITELLSERSQATYMFYQLQSFAPPGEVSDSQAVSQAGVLMASWAAAQSIVAVWWGRAANSPRLGRKGVLLIGLAGTAVSGLGSGFAQSFNQLLLLKVIAGGLNTNLGIMRTMIGETTEPRFESKAFLLLPMCLNIGDVLGPLLGGFLADPSVSDSSEATTSNDSSNNSDSSWMSRFPFALPNFICALVILISALMVAFGLDETHPSLTRNGRDRCREMGRWIFKKLWTSGVGRGRYERLARGDDEELASISMLPEPYPSSGEGNPGRVSLDSTSSSTVTVVTQPTSQFQNNTILPRVMTWRVGLTLLTHFTLMLHLSAFNTITPSFLSTQRAGTTQNYLNLHLAGGLGLSLYQVGLAVAVLGLIGLSFQLLVYPIITSKISSYMSYRMFLPFSALAYFFLPFIVLLRKDSWVLWPVLLLLFGFQAVSRTFAQPGMIILINSCGSHPHLRSTIHGMGLSVGSLARILGPIGSGWALRIGLERNMVGGIWWCMAFAVAVNWILLLTLRLFDLSHKKSGAN
ncbi:major facilitator superfamily domain-containing protein [Ilyonectria robusta]|uniref:major facilitator superfamily domain-containing protein n=1 Tax=Ilyonectria robusta TaxID=1079257 RepID=UPI001E8E9C17|nr:major facilitator superfamily domain-containing protein [Ilyonectria robusta]KAH8669428.1 major facilitator superfamily domain-containing protein [Ilyonectria robusta]